MNQRVRESDLGKGEGSERTLDGRVRRELCRGALGGVVCLPRFVAFAAGDRKTAKERAKVAILQIRDRSVLVRLVCSGPGISNASHPRGRQD